MPGLIHTPPPQHPIEHGTRVRAIGSSTPLGVVDAKRYDRYGGHTEYRVTAPLTGTIGWYSDTQIEPCAPERSVDDATVERGMALLLKRIGGRS